MNGYSFILLAVIWATCATQGLAGLVVALAATYFVVDVFKDDDEVEDNCEDCSDCCGNCETLVPDEREEDPAIVGEGFTTSGPVFPEKVGQGHVHFLETEVDIKVYQLNGTNWDYTGTLQYPGRKPAVMATIIEE